MEMHADGLWSIRHPLQLGGMAFGTRTAVLRTDQGVLLVSPGPLDDAQAAAIEAVGPVRYVIAPNVFHHLFARAAAERFGVPVLGVDGLEGKLERDGALSDADLGPDVAMVPLEGQRSNETVFVHHPSRTLVVTDLTFHFVGPMPALTRLQLQYIFGAYGGLMCSRLTRWVVTRDRAALRRSLDAVEALPWDHLSVAHGEPFLPDARPAWEQATRWTSAAP